jgi:ATP-dependent Clp protease ATP-binding subunit ClpA
MFERFTNQSRYAIVAAQEEARSLDHDYIGSEHLLLGLLREDQGTSARALASAGITLEAARHDVEALIGRGERPPSGHIPFTRPAKKCLELSLREALQLGHRYIGSGHLLLGLMSQGDSAAVKVLGRLGADLDQLRARVIQELEDHPENQDDLSYAARPEPLSPRPEPLSPRPEPLSPRPEPLSPRPEPLSLRPVTLRRQPAIPALLDRIEERLTAIERHLGIASEKAGDPGDAGAPGSPENVVPPS